MDPLLANTGPFIAEKVVRKAQTMAKLDYCVKMSTTKDKCVQSNTKN